MPTPVRDGGDAWTPPLLWQGETVFILGGGPSLQGFDFRRLVGRRILATNTAGADVVEFAGAGDVLFGHDADWFCSNPDLVGRWPGLVVTISQHAAAHFAGRIHRVVTRELADFVRRQPFIKRGRSSGHSAISLAIAMGAACVVLLGFDMRLVAGRSHYHDRYGHKSERIYRADFIPKFRGWDAAARRIGCAVFNCTPDSALLEFRRGDLVELLKVRPS